MWRVEVRGWRWRWRWRVEGGVTRLEGSRDQPLSDSLLLTRSISADNVRWPVVRWPPASASCNQQMEDKKAMSVAASAGVHILHI